MTPSVVRTGLTAGLIAGLLESLSHLLHHALFGERIPLGYSLSWMPAAANATLFVMVAVVLVGVGRLWPDVVTKPRVVGLFATLLTTASLRRFDGVLGPISVDLLAVGVGVQLTRWSTRRASPAPRWTRLAGPILASAVVLAVAGGEWYYHREERRIAGAARAPASSQPNVLLLVLDAVRAENLSLYGYARATTPAIAQFAAGGARFERAMSVAPWTLPGHAGLFTGRWAHELSSSWDVPLDGTYATLAEALT